MLAALLVVLALAGPPSSSCDVPIDVELEAGELGDAADQVISAGRAAAVVLLWFGSLALAIFAMRRVVAFGQQRSIWMYANWHRRIQGAVASTVGRFLMVGAVVGILALAALGACDVPGWFNVVAGCALFVGLMLAVLGSAVSTEAGWVGFALVVITDLLSAAVLGGNAVLDPESRQASLVGVLAFTIHATCTAVACRWSFVVSTMPGARADDRAKAGETGRSLCALWVLLLIAMLVLIFDEDLIDRAISLLTSPVVVALTLGALAVTLGSGHTKYVEAREAARRRVRDRRARTTTFDRRDDLVPRIAARMIASCGPLSTADLVVGVNRLAAFDLGERRLRRELSGSWLLTRHSAPDTWDLAPGVDPAPHRWPTDRVLRDLAGAGRFDATGIAGLLDAAGYQGLATSGYLRDTHPLLRTHGSRFARRWSVLPSGPDQSRA